MHKIIYLLIAVFITGSCTTNSKKSVASAAPNPALATMLEQYYNERMQLLPLEATANGDTLYNNLLPADFTDSYRARLKDFFTRYNIAINGFDTTGLNDNDKKSWLIFNYDMGMALEGLDNTFLASPDKDDNSYLPFDQLNGVPLFQHGQTVPSFILKKGIEMNEVFPMSVVVKMIPQMQDLVTSDATKSLFYGPVLQMPAQFGATDKKRLTAAYVDMINTSLVPSYKKLADFLQTEYLPKARTSTGINALPGGDKKYAYLVKFWTTTNKAPEEIYQAGLSEVKRIRTAMEQVKNETGFKGSLDSFFNFMKTDKQFMPYKNADEVLASLRKIQATAEPNVKKTVYPYPKNQI
jgi:uncharacterized protein (DUF885 family)